MKSDLSKYNNDWYAKQIGAGRFIQTLWYFVNIIFFKTGLFPVSSLKVGLLRLFGAKIGNGVVIKPCINIKYPWKLVIGNHCWIGENVWIDNLGNVIIGDNVCLSQGVFLFSGNHNYKIESFDLSVEPIKIEHGVWLGAFSIVCPGVTCKSHSVLSVNSVATKDLNEYSIYQGNPAQFTRSRNIS